jgi:hypothetical protein
MIHMIRIFPLVSRGKSCPRCGSRAERVPTPLLLRPIRWLALSGATRRRCAGRCGWRGFAFPSADHVRRPAADAEHEPLHQL